MAKSIITQLTDYCYICGRRATETHHATCSVGLYDRRR